MMMKPAFVTTLSSVSPHQPSPPSCGERRRGAQREQQRGQGEEVQRPAHRCPIIWAECVAAFSSCSAFSSPSRAAAWPRRRARSSRRRRPLRRPPRPRRRRRRRPPPRRRPRHRRRRPPRCHRRRPSCSSPSWPATPSPRRACSCAGAGAAPTTAGPRPSSSTCGRWACAPRRTGARSWPARPRAARPSPARRATAYVVRARTRATAPTPSGPPRARPCSSRSTSAAARSGCSRGWRKQRRAGAWNGATAAATSSKATAKLRFTKRRVRVIARRFPSAGRLAVTLDGRRSVVSLAGPLGERQVAFDSGRAARRRTTACTRGPRAAASSSTPSHPVSGQPSLTFVRPLHSGAESVN